MNEMEDKEIELAARVIRVGKRGCAVIYVPRQPAIQQYIAAQRITKGMNVVVRFPMPQAQPQTSAQASA